jgi:MFS family permease
MLFFWGPVAGKFVDDYGPRLPILLGSFLHVFGLMMVSISDKYYQIFLAQAVCSAIGCSFLFYPSIAACGTWFLKHRALAFGIMVAGSSIGGVVMPIMVQKLLPRIGFGWSMRSVAFLILGLLIFGNLTVRSRLPPMRRPIRLMDFLMPFTEVPFLLLAISSFFIYIGGFLPFNFLIVQGQASGMSLDLAQYLIPIVNAAS